ncbi:hypothetical protein PIB30_084938 [Stylosanthes scabra]|uniref:Uncharacterized protein n=1 Tax=Stylosanthes scabra TaxID=79078 RepID=A0ABU6US46_9FABA|nr:hypothetical protein [Stylosanthes scabra]
MGTPRRVSGRLGVVGGKCIGRVGVTPRRAGLSGVGSLTPRRGSARLGVGGLGYGMRSTPRRCLARLGVMQGEGLVGVDGVMPRRGLARLGMEGVMLEKGQVGVPTPRHGMSRVGIGLLSGRMLGEGECVVGNLWGLAQWCLGVKLHA